MRRSLIGRSFVAVALVMLAPLPLRAGLITWGPATTISGDSDVVTTGTLLYAYNMGPSGVAATTVNGVTFAPFAIPNTSPQSVVIGDVGLAESPDVLFGLNRFGNAFTPYSALSTPYKNLLGYWATAGQDGTVTVTLGGLTVGQDYTVQWWASDATGYFGSTTATGVSNVSLDTNTNNASGGVGQYAVGTFTASGTAQTFDLTGAGGFTPLPIINGLQVRTYASPGPTPVPEVDPGLAGGAVAVVTAVLALRERRRRPAAAGPAANG